jgi:hypothetical protein
MEKFMQAPIGAMVRLGSERIDRPPFPNLLSIAICGGILRIQEATGRMIDVGARLSEKIILKQRDETMIRAHVNGS